MPLIDSHAHLDFYTETPDALEGVLARAREAGVEAILAIGIGEGPETMHRALGDRQGESRCLRERRDPSAGGRKRYPGGTCEAGESRRGCEMHRHRRDWAGTITTSRIRFRVSSRPRLSLKCGIAATARKPILIHCRTSELATPAAKDRFEQHGNPDAAWDDLLALIGEHWTSHGLGGIMHCFSGTPEQAAGSHRSGLPSFFCRQPDLSEIDRHSRRLQQTLQPNASWLKPTLRFWLRFRTAGGRTSRLS